MIICTFVSEGNMICSGDWVGWRVAVSSDVLGEMVEEVLEFLRDAAHVLH